MAFVRTRLAYQIICQSVTDLYHDGHDHASVSDCGCGMMNESESDHPSSVWRMKRKMTMASCSGELLLKLEWPGHYGPKISKQNEHKSRS